MGSAECGKKVVKRCHAGNVNDLDRCRNAALPFAVQKIIGADAEIENIARFDARGIVIVVFLARKSSVASLRQ